MTNDLTGLNVPDAQTAIHVFLDDAASHGRGTSPFGSVDVCFRFIPDADATAGGQDSTAVRKKSGTVYPTLMAREYEHFFTQCVPTVLPACKGWLSFQHIMTTLIQIPAHCQWYRLVAAATVHREEEDREEGLEEQWLT